MSSDETQMNPLPVDPVAIVEIAQRAHDLEDRATSLYLANPESLDEIRSAFEEAASHISSTVKGIIDIGYSCPMGTIKCPRGCCYPRETILRD